MRQIVILIFFVLFFANGTIKAMSCQKSIDSATSMHQLLNHASHQSKFMFYLFQRAYSSYISSKDEDIFVAIDKYLNNFFKKAENQIAQQQKEKHQLNVDLPPLPDTPVNNDAISICGNLIINLCYYNGTKMEVRYYEDALSLSHEIILFLEKITKKTEISDYEQKMLLFSLLFFNEALSDIAISCRATPIISQLRSNIFPQLKTAQLLLEANYYIFCTIFDTGIISNSIGPIFYFNNNRRVLRILLSYYGEDELIRIMKAHKIKDPQELYSTLFRLLKNIVVKSKTTLEIHY